MILDRIRANGGDVIRDGWRLRLRRGRLTDSALVWIKAHWAELASDVWPEWDAFEERAAILEHCAGMPRGEAEAEAYRQVMKC